MSYIFGIIEVVLIIAGWTAIGMLFGAIITNHAIAQDHVMAILWFFAACICGVTAIAAIFRASNKNNREA